MLLTAEASIRQHTSAAYASIHKKHALQLVRAAAPAPARRGFRMLTYADVR